MDFTVGDETYTGFLLNIGSTGLFLHTRLDLLPGTSLELKFSLPGSEEIIIVRGMVAWATSSSATKSLFGGAGIKYSDIQEKDLESIKEFVSDEIKKMHLY